VVEHLGRGLRPLGAVDLVQLDAALDQEVDVLLPLGDRRLAVPGETSSISASTIARRSSGQPS